MLISTYYCHCIIAEKLHIGYYKVYELTTYVGYHINVSQHRP